MSDFDKHFNAESLRELTKSCRDSEQAEIVKGLLTLMKQRAATRATQGLSNAGWSRDEIKNLDDQGMGILREETTALGFSFHAHDANAAYISW